MRVMESDGRRGRREGSGEYEGWGDVGMFFSFLQLTFNYRQRRYQHLIFDIRVLRDTNLVCFYSTLVISAYSLDHHRQCPVKTDSAMTIGATSRILFSRFLPSTPFHTFHYLHFHSSLLSKFQSYLLYFLTICRQHINHFKQDWKSHNDLINKDDLY